jgi:pimeloyl-ACP methyl ester carboxylesterase
MAELDHPVEGTLRRADGRQIAYTRSGEPDGRPVLFCHGTPGARLFRPPDSRLPAQLGVELVTADRPGYGRSTRQPGRTLLDWPATSLRWPMSCPGVGSRWPGSPAVGRTRWRVGLRCPSG